MEEDRGQDRAEDRRRRGPLGDEGDAEETRRAPQARDDEDAATRRLPPEDAGREDEARATEKALDEASAEEDPETRVIRTPGTSEEDAMSYPRNYMEAADQREARLREVYGGVDWLASFIGCIFALLCSVVLLLLLSGFVFVPLGFTLNLEGREIDTVLIAGLAIVGLVLFVAYFCGGYVAGRLARFDGGRNGAATVLWGILLIVVFLLVGSLLPGPFFDLLRGFVGGSVAPAVSSLTETGLAGAGIVVGSLLLELLGGFLGGRVGHSYHVRIDHTT